MITHDSAFETLALAPVKQTNIIVARQFNDPYGYYDDGLTWTSSDLLMSVKVDAVGQFLGTATKKAVVKLLGIVAGAVAENVFQVRVGIYNNDPSVSGFDYISEGFFIVDNVAYDYEAGSTTITMYDYMWTAQHTSYANTAVLTGFTYPATVAALAQQMASAIGVSLMANFSALPNASYNILVDPYATISNATVATVIEEIAQTTGTTARVSDTTLVFSQYDLSSENLGSTALKTLKIGKPYGVVTSVILGRVPQNDNVVIARTSPLSNTVSAVDASTNLLTVTASGMPNGNLVQLESTGTLPAPLLAAKNYYTNNGGSANTFVLYDNYKDATASDSPPLYAFGTETLGTGSTPWSFFSVGTNYGGATATLDTSYKVSAKNSLAFAATATGSAQAVKVLAADVDYGYFSLSVFFPTGWALGTAAAVPLLGIRNNSDVDVIFFQVENFSGVYRLTTWNAPTSTYADTGIVIDIGQINNFQFYFNQSTTVGSIKVWKNNSVSTSPNYSSGNVNTGTLKIRKLCFGLAYVSGTVNTFYEDNFAYNPTFMSNLISGGQPVDLTSVGSGSITLSHLTTQEVDINNNQIMDDDRVTLLPNLYAKLAGLQWNSVKATTVGLGWHEIGDVIQFTQGSSVYKAFLSEVHLTFEGSIKEDLVSVIPDVSSINYQTAGGVLKTIYNTEIKVDKQNNTITSVVSQQDIFATTTTNNFTQLYQDLTNILLTIQKSGGGNLVLNSVGFATEAGVDNASVGYTKLSFWDYNPSYQISTHGAVSSFSSSESQNAGGTSGQAVQMSGASVYISQRVNVAASTPLSFALRVKNAIGTGSATITISNTTDTFTIPISSATAYVWNELKLENFVSSIPWLDIKIQVTGATAFLFTDLRLLYGTNLQGWVQSSSEILSTNVQFSKLGMKIFDNVHDTETQVTYNEFSTRRKADNVILFEADDSGVVTNDLSIKGSTTYVSGVENIVKQVTIPSSSALAGIAFIKAVS